MRVPEGISGGILRRNSGEFMINFAMEFLKRGIREASLVTIPWGFVGRIRGGFSGYLVLQK